MRTRSAGLIVGLLAGAVALVPAASAAAATAGPKPSATITVGNLILEPTSRGYVGTLSASVQWNGPDDGWLDIVIVEPVAGAWQNMNNGDGCVWNTATADGRRTDSCGLSGLRHGEVRDIAQSFRVLTATQPFAMSAVSADIWAQQGDTVISKVKHYSTTFRGTNGSVTKPSLYVQDLVSNASLALRSNSVTMVQQPDGYFLGHLPVTVTWNGDAAHYFVNIDAALPNGWFVWDTDPESGYPCAGGCSVPGPNGGALMQGEVVSFDLIVYAPEGTAPGVYSNNTAHVGAYWVNGQLTDVSPADNDGTFTATL
jgi:hypothetical protein